MQRETAKRLLDARTACEEIAHFTAGRSQDAILTDRGLQLILQTLVSTIGEALGQLRRADPDVAATIPDLHRIIGMRNQIVCLRFDRLSHRLEGCHRRCTPAEDHPHRIDERPRCRRDVGKSRIGVGV